MKILKSGNTSLNIKRFECEHCGCIFEADDTEYVEDWRTPKPECECPTCHKITNQTIGRNRYVPI